MGDPVVLHNFVEWGYGYILVETNLVGVELLATQLQHSQLLYYLISGWSSGPFPSVCHLNSFASF